MGLSTSAGKVGYWETVPYLGQKKAFHRALFLSQLFMYKKLNPDTILIIVDLQKLIDRIPAMLDKEMSKLVAQANEIDKSVIVPIPKPRKWSKALSARASTGARKVSPLFLLFSKPYNVSLGKKWFWGFDLWLNTIYRVSILKQIE